MADDVQGGLTDAQKEMCRKLVDSWYWQIQERGSWAYKWHEETMVRYYECAMLEADVFPVVLSYLQNMGAVQKIELHGKSITLESGWKANRAWYQTIESDVSATNKLKRVRIYQALIKSNDDSDGDGPYVVENGCQYKVSFTFFWNQGAAPSDVPASESGVNYQYQSISRDSDTGLWSYILVKRERQQQDIDLYDQQKTVFETQQSEQHLGVRANDVATTGQAASVSGGVMVQRRLSKNDDCTSNIDNQVITEISAPASTTETQVTLRGTRTTTINRNQADKAAETNLDVGQTVRNDQTPGGLWNQTIVSFARAAAGVIRKACQKTIFLHTHSETSNQADDPGFTDVSDAAGGVVTQKTVSRNEDGTYDVTTDTRTETAVASAVVQTVKELDGITVTTTNRNQAKAASTEGMKIGESISSEKTEGGLYNTVERRVSTTDVGTTGEGCQQTALEHQHTTTSNVATDPGPMEIKSLDAGTVKQQQKRLTAKGTYDVTTVTTTAKAKSTTVASGTVSRSVSTSVMRNASSITSAAGTTNVEVSASVQPNQFGLYDGQVTTVTYSPDSKTVTGGAVLATTSTTVGVNQTTEPSEAPAVNKSVDIGVSMNEHGSMTTSKRVVTYVAQTKTVAGGASLASTSTTVGVNQTSVPTGTVAVNKAIDISASINEHGSMTTSKREITYVPGTKTVAAGCPLYSESTDVGVNQLDITSAAGGVGTTVHASVSLNEHGSLSTTKTTRTAVAISKQFSWADGNASYLAVVYRNQSAPMTLTGGDHVSCSSSINEFGLYDGTAIRKTLKEDSRRNWWARAGSTDWSTTYTLTERRISHHNGKDWDQTLTYSITEGEQDDRAKAYSAINGGGQGTYVRPYGSVYRYRKVSVPVITEVEIQGALNA